MTSTQILKEPFLNPACTTILVTGASGYIASHIVNEALLLGYSVRGTARTQEKATKTHKTFQDNPRYSTVIVSDFGHASQEVDNAVKGVNAIVHVAADMTFSGKPESIQGVVRGTELLLQAAAKEESVRRFVLTSSSTAALLPLPNTEFTVTGDTWNDIAVETAYNKRGESIGPNSYPFVVYAAMKTQSEKALWKFMKEQNPPFTANAILPNMNFGRILDSPGATGSIVPFIFEKGERPPLTPQYFIDVIDDARLHLIAAVLDESIVNQRIFAFAEPFNLNDCVEAIRRVRPDVKSEMKIDEAEGRDLSKVATEKGAELLRAWYGQNGYKMFDQSVAENLEGY
ncbi:hypothetical protein LTR05_007179 [Lithohypha guttulata]|uniref:NAD-dependent epimerase/dehydratase domain-containing protein n=1 Tax=Lithohypha guttulata TaxID=1690604 RepID=A0AAN7SUK7_9EURO|nr:hypothetical protein LTR05_007179 [Lithohypha guttulata]